MKIGSRSAYVLSAAALASSFTLAIAQGPNTVSHYENLDSKHRFHFAMTKTLNGEIIEEAENIVQYYKDHPISDLHVFLFDTLMNDAQYSMVYYQHISDDQSFTYGYLNSATDGIDVEAEKYIDLQGPLEVGREWEFNVLYPSKPMVIDHPNDLRYTFTASITTKLDQLQLHGFSFSDCIEVVHRGVSDAEFSLTCGESKVEHANVIMTVTRMYCAGLGPVHEEAEQHLESRGALLTDCNKFSYVSPLTNVEEISPSTNTTTSRSKSGA